MYFGLMGASVLVAVFLAWPRQQVSAKSPVADVEVTVRVGDIFEATDNVVIGTNDVFDTHIGDDIISSRSVQGQFVANRFDGSVSTLDVIIEDLLKDLP